MERQAGLGRQGSALCFKLASQHEGRLVPAQLACLARICLGHILLMWLYCIWAGYLSKEGTFFFFFLPSLSMSLKTNLGVICTNVVSHLLDFWADDIEQCVHFESQIAVLSFFYNISCFCLFLICWCLFSRWIF